MVRRLNNCLWSPLLHCVFTDVDISLGADIFIESFHKEWKNDYKRLERVHSYIQWYVRVGFGLRVIVLHSPFLLENECELQQLCIAYCILRDVVAS